MITFTDIGLIVGGAVAGYILAKIVDYWNASRLMKKFKQEIDNQQEEVKQDKINVPLRKDKSNPKYPETSPDADASFTKSGGKKRLNKPSPPQTQNENSTLSEMPVQVDIQES